MKGLCLPGIRMRCSSCFDYVMKKIKAHKDIRGLGDIVVVQPLPMEHVTGGGIIIPGTAEEKNQKAVVVNHGKGRIRKNGQVVPLSVAVGDVVIFGKYNGTELKIAGVDFIIIKEENILGVIGKMKRNVN